MRFPRPPRRTLRRSLLGAGWACALLLVFAASADAIVGGQAAPAGRWPWMAALLSGRAHGAAAAQTCGATVIGPRRVLTAGHCVLGTPARELRVLLGRTRLTAHDGRIVRVTGVSVFPGFVTQHRPGLDAAVLTLARDAGVPPLRVATPADRGAWGDGTPAWTMGWGQLNAKRSPGGHYYYADRLRDVQVSIIGDLECEGEYGLGVMPEMPYRPAWSVCAGVPDRDAGTCYGDSGGPLVVADGTQWLEVGIVASGDGCGEAHYADLYSRVDNLGGFPTRPHPIRQPEARRPPQVRGDLREGAVLRCDPGLWSGSAARLDIRWARAGGSGAVVGEAGPTHRVTAGDARGGITCGVIARNAGGYAIAVASPLEPSRSTVADRR